MGSKYLCVMTKGGWFPFIQRLLDTKNLRLELVTSPRKTTARFLKERTSFHPTTSRPVGLLTLYSAWWGLANGLLGHNTEGHQVRGGMYAHRSARLLGLTHWDAAVFLFTEGRN